MWFRLRCELGLWCWLGLTLDLWFGLWLALRALLVFGGALLVFGDALVLLGNALLQAREPTLALLFRRDRFRLLGRAFSLLDSALRLVGAAFMRRRFSRGKDRVSFGSRVRAATRLENFDRFGGASSLRPIDSVEPKVISQLRIGPGFEQEWDEMRVTEDRGED